MYLSNCTKKILHREILFNSPTRFEHCFDFNYALPVNKHQCCGYSKQITQIIQFWTLIAIEIGA